MAFLAGVDEAGYGPLLGPFVVGWSLFRVPDAECDLWQVTRAAATRKPTGRTRTERRLWVDDSKLVHAGTLGRGRLARSVAAFRELAAPARAELWRWIEEPPAPSSDWLRRAPWLADLDAPLCPEIDAGRARLDAAALRRTLEAGGCNLAGFGARAVPAVEWNAFLDRYASKSSALFAVTAEVLRHLLQLTGDAPLRIELDQHGARTRYARALELALRPDRVIPHDEGPRGSSYTLLTGGREVQIRFQSEADRLHFPTALGSLAAKLTRERLMDLFNAWFGARLGGVRPTKGYTQDARRWLEDAGTALDALELPPEILIRNA